MPLAPLSESRVAHDVERPQRQRRPTLVVDVETASGLPPEEVPRRVRLTELTGQNGRTPQIGDSISGTAMLAPCRCAVSPGGAFDYGRSLFFEAIGGTGRFTAPPIRGRREDPPALSVALRSLAWSSRQAIGARIRQHVIEGPLAAHSPMP